MIDIILDGALMKDRESMHDVLTENFQLPSYYGRNLDALWDMLTERNEAMSVALLNPELMPPDIQRGLTALLLECARTRDKFTFQMRSDAIRPGNCRCGGWM